MIDLNTLISNALIAAVQQAVAPLNERIAALESCNAERHQRLLVLEGALTDRVVALEGDVSHKVQVQQANITAALAERIAALELQRGEMQRTIVTYSERIAALETKLTEANLFTQTSNVTIPIDEARMVEALNSQEWFWEKLQNRIDSTVEAGIDDHCSTYDHDSYDNAVSDLEDRDFVTNDSLEDAVREAVGNLSFDISVS